MQDSIRMKGWCRRHPSATTKWISLKALILMPSDKQVLITVDDECDYIPEGLALVCTTRT